MKILKSDVLDMVALLASWLFRMLTTVSLPGTLDEISQSSLLYMVALLANWLFRMFTSISLSASISLTVCLSLCICLSLSVSLSLSNTVAEVIEVHFRMNESCHKYI